MNTRLVAYAALTIIPSFLFTVVVARGASSRPVPATPPAATTTQRTQPSRAQQAVTLANLRGMGLPAAEYMETNKKWPESLAVLVASGKISPDTLLDKRTANPPMTAPAPGTDWKSIAAAVDASCGFYYVGKGMPAEVYSFILFYDKAADGKRLIGFSDAHSEAMDQGSGALSQAITTTNELRKKANLPLLPEDLKGPPK